MTSKFRYEYHINDQLLMIEYYCKSTGYFLFDMPIAHLMEDEMSLNKGRFLFYATSSQDHKIKRTFEYEDFHFCLNWVAENVKQYWSYDVEWINMNHIGIIWSFKNLTDALLFKLSI